MRRDEAYLADMVREARNAKAFVSGMSIEQFAASSLHQHAVSNALLIIGEAAAHVSSAWRDRMPDVPWVKIIGMRNQLVHGYFDLDIEIMWDTVRINLPMLIAAIDSHLLDDHV